MNGPEVQNAPLRLAQYLKEFVGLRTTTIRDVVKYDSVLWFGSMPQEQDCRSPAWDEGSDPGDPWLEVKKQQFEKAPAPPGSILAWVDEKALRKATQEMSALRPHILVPDAEAELIDGESPPLIELSLGDCPEVQQAYDRYRPKWEAWSIEYRRCEAIQKVYAELFSLHTQVRKQGEIIELVLGLGLLDWRAKLHGSVIPIRRHAVVARIELEFDPAKGVIRVVAPGDGAHLRIEDDMLEAELRPERTHYETMEMQLDAIGDEIWDKAQMHTALKLWAGALNADSQWSPALGAQPGSAKGPMMSFAPALILRKRTQTGMVRIYNALIGQLSDDSIEVPEGWGGLVDDVDDRTKDASWEGDTHSLGENLITPSQIYFPLPANREQRRIVEAIERQRGVLVQGPPGTGKSHTIANLICHLLATGKRVLITAETGRALQVLKDKLPRQIQPLCVSLLGQGGDAFAELNTAVQGITTKQAAYTPGAYDGRIAEIDHDLDEARRRLAETESEIHSLREEETYPHSIANGAYHGTASFIAARVAGEREMFTWLQLPRETSIEPACSKDEVMAWLDILRRYTEQEICETKQRIPSSEELPSPLEFSAAVSAEEAASSEVAKLEELRSHPAYGSIHALAADVREQLKKNLQALEKQRTLIERIEDEWCQVTARDLIAGRRARWDAVAEVSRDRLTKIEKLLVDVGDLVVTFPNGHDLRKIRTDAEAVLSHFKQGGQWKKFGFITPKELKGRTYLKDEVLVDGTGASNTWRLQTVCDFLDIEFALTKLGSTWSGVGAPVSEGDLRLRVAELKEKLSNLEQSFVYTDSCHQLGQSMATATPPIPEPVWLEGQAQRWIELVDATAVEDRYQVATATVNACLDVLNRLRSLHDSHSVVQTLSDAVQAMDVNTYSQCYARIVAIETTRTDQKRRKEIENILAKAVPGLIEKVTENLVDPIWNERFDKWDEAWRWAVTDIWLEKRSDFEYQQNLWRRRHEIENKIGKLLAEASALRAWTHFFKRLSPKESAALKSWREAVRAMGKGTGKSAKLARLRQEARQYMDACRDAIPIWIMPRYLVAEMVDPAPGRYDLVIVDEASQLGIESLFLFYIAKKIIVVGDDQQISPYGVGISDEAIAGLQHHYLDGIPHRHALSAQSSLYGNAKIRFSQNIVLREHFRCMPEIIQFSNDLCYASNGTPLDPLRAYPANRLQPLVLRHVAEGYRVGGVQNAQNPAEADAIVAQIAACIEDPRYAGATMGVISLQGDAQAKLIERKLLEHLEPEVIESRRLICGDAYAFQGDERKIIFLSMVAAPGETRIGALTTESARQRFNVAVSRAQDQLWLFHTATLDVLSDTCMRYRLLSYMLDPARKTTEESEQIFDSNFERDVFQLITEQGFHVRTQVSVGDPTNHRYRIDLVVEGMQGRLAVECDGDKWHGPERYEHDMARQRDLERAGWQFVRIRGGDFYRDPAVAMQPVWSELERLGIRPGGVDKIAAEPPAPICPDALVTSGMTLLESSENESPIVNDEIITALSSTNDVDTVEVPQMDSPVSPPPPDKDETEQEQLQTSAVSSAHQDPSSLPVQSSSSVNNRAPYVAFKGQAGPDPRNSSPTKVAEGLCKIIDVEGPMLAKRAYDIYLRGCGIRRLGGELKRSMNKALQQAVSKGVVVKEDEAGKGGLMYAIVRPASVPPVILRDRGPREFEEIPPSELQLVARRLVKDIGYKPGSDEHLRAILDFFDLKRLTTQVGTSMLDIIARQYRYVDEIIGTDNT